MTIYTKTGDAGSAQLPSGLRLSKGDVRFEALGTLDELNCLIGWCLAEPRSPDTLRQDLAWVQDRIMTLCSQLASLTSQPPGKAPPLELTPADTARLETAIDAVASQMEMPRWFVVPGGSELSCRLHQARTCCRRAERYTVRCLEEANEQALPLRAFINRLSDTLFAWALYANHLAQIPNPPWQAKR